MGYHPAIGYESFPKQSNHVGKKAEVIFGYNFEKRLQAKVIPDDLEDPFRTLLQLEDGRVVEGKECQWSPRG